MLHSIFLLIYLLNRLLLNKLKSFKSTITQRNREFQIDYYLVTWKVLNQLLLNMENCKPNERSLIIS